MGDQRTWTWLLSWHLSTTLGIYIYMIHTYVPHGTISLMARSLVMKTETNWTEVCAASSQNGWFLDYSHIGTAVLFPGIRSPRPKIRSLWWEMRTQEHFKWKLMLETSSSQYKRLCLIDKSSQLTTTAYMHSTQKKNIYIYIYMN